MAYLNSFQLRLSQVIHYIILQLENRGNGDFFPSKHKSITVCCYMVIMVIAVAIDNDTPVNSAFIHVIDREMISQSVLPTHHTSIFPAKSTHVVKMAARIEAGAPINPIQGYSKSSKIILH